MIKMSYYISEKEIMNNKENFLLFHKEKCGKV